MVLVWAGCGGDGFVAETAPGDAAADAADGAADARQDEASPDVRDTGTPDVADWPDAPPDADLPDAPHESAPPCPSVKMSEVIAEADGVIIDGNCQGANSFLNGPFANVGAGRGLLRFRLDSPTANAFVQGKVLSLRVDLRRNDLCDGSACPSHAGLLEAYPLRNDWDEGSNQGYTGADWCRRLAGNPGPPWNAPGASQDHGALAAGLQVTDSQPNLSIPLEPAVFTTEWVPGQRLSVLLVPNGATFVFATHENTQLNPPRLVVEYCE